MANELAVLLMTAPIFYRRL